MLTVEAPNVQVLDATPAAHVVQSRTLTQGDREQSAGVQPPGLWPPTKKAFSIGGSNFT
jgi:hypothetical protein